MESAAENIKWYLMDERWKYSPDRCPSHQYEYCGMEFVNKFPCRVYKVHRCMNCGNVMYGVMSYGAVGPNSFDLDDPQMKRGGILGEDWINRQSEKDLREMGY